MKSSTSLALYQQSPSLDVNSATERELQEHVPGVGRVLARRIVAYREQHGPFQSEEDLGRVIGVNQRIAALLAPCVVAEPVPESAARWLTAPPSNAVHPIEQQVATLRPGPPVPRVSAPPRVVDEGKPAAGAPRPRAWKWLSVGLVLFGTLAGHALGVWLNARSIEAPKRELMALIEAVQADQTTAEANAAVEASHRRAAMQDLTALVDDQATQERAAQDRTERALDELRTAAKRSGARTDAQLQRLRSDLDRMERSQKAPATPQAIVMNR